MEEHDAISSLADVHTESGTALLALCHESPVLLVFLRHFGCSFCRRTIDDIAKLQSELTKRNVRPVFVHLGTPAIAQAHFNYYGISAVERIHDPQAAIYRLSIFGLGRVHPARNLINPAVVWTWLVKAQVFRYGMGKIQNDGHQMPGVFLLRDGNVTRAFRHRNISDQPNYLKLIAG